MGAAMVSWFTDMDGDTISWMIIALMMCIGVLVASLYWDRFLYRVSQQENRRSDSE